MTWNGRQLSTLGVDGKTVSYTYDADGQRTAKTVGTDQTTYLYIGGQLCKVNNPTAELEFFYDDDGRALGFSISSERYGYAKFYYVYNAQGDVVQLRDAANNVTANYLYDAWGKLLHICTYSGVEITDASDAALLNPIRYRGYVYDSETGLYYLNSRYYDPQLGRFVNADGYASTGQGITGNNMFAYCGNNPVNRKDPTGQFWITALIVTAVAVVCTVTLSGCSAQPTSDVGAAKPYVDMPGSDDPTSPNCYAYAIGSPVNEQPGGTSGRIPTKWNDVNDVGKSVEADLKAKGHTVREISGPDAKVYDNEFKIALRVGTQP